MSGPVDRAIGERTGGRAAGGRRPARIALLLLLILAFAPTAGHAHQRLVRSEPARETALDAAPREIRFFFVEPIELTFTSVELLGPEGTNVPLGELRLHPDSANVLIAPIAAPLPREGGYVVRWATASRDGHPVRGEFTFTIAPGAAALVILSVACAPRAEPHVMSPAGGVAHAAAPARAEADSAAVAATVDRFHRALAEGDSATALNLLTEDAIILESGGVETREEYRGHHLPGDIAFAQAVRTERSPMRVVVRGDAAWATSTSTVRGEYRGRQINSQGAELMVLTRTPEGWRISAIHWSSRQLRQ